MNGVTLNRATNQIVRVPEKYSVDFNVVWKLGEYSTRDVAKSTILPLLDEDEYKITYKPNGDEVIKITSDAFKQCMLFGDNELADAMRGHYLHIDDTFTQFSQKQSKQRKKKEFDNIVEDDIGGDIDEKGHKNKNKKVKFDKLYHKHGNYQNKKKAEEAILPKLVQNDDYSIDDDGDLVVNERGFKKSTMFAKNEMGKKARRYFLSTERELAVSSNVQGMRFKSLDFAKIIRNHAPRVMKSDNKSKRENHKFGRDDKKGNNDNDDKKGNKDDDDKKGGKKK